MEENNLNEESNMNQTNKHVCFENHCWKKCLAMICASFLGGFLAFYFVADQIMQKHYRHIFNPHRFEKRMLNDMDRMYKRDVQAFENSFKIHNPMQRMKEMKDSEFKMPIFMMDSVKIKTEFDDEKFNIIIGLKPFQNDMNKINYKVNGRKLTIFGNSEIKDKNFEHDVAFSQDFILPENADTENITKIKEGNKLTISVPIKER